MKIIQAPDRITGNKLLFLVCSNEAQQKVIELLSNTDWNILASHHDDWGDQGDWELEAMERARDILIVFDPNIKSSLLELGLFARSKKMVVVCPEGFWRKNNVDTTCRAYGILHFKTLEDAMGMYL